MWQPGGSAATDFPAPFLGQLTEGRIKSQYSTELDTSIADCKLRQRWT